MISIHIIQELTNFPNYKWIIEARAWVLQTTCWLNLQQHLFHHPCQEDQAILALHCTDQNRQQNSL